MRRTVSTAIAVAAAAAMAGCGGGDRKVSGPPPPAPARIALSSPAFPSGGTIPRPYTCTGAGTSPALRWRGVPAGARSLALLVVDPDAPGGTFVHWTAWGIAPAATALPAGARPPHQGGSSTGNAGWTPPCPPPGSSPHRYVFTLYALRRPLTVADDAPPDAVRQAIAGVALARGSLVGRFGR